MIKYCTAEILWGDKVLLFELFKCKCIGYGNKGVLGKRMSQYEDLDVHHNGLSLTMCQLKWEKLVWISSTSVMVSRPSNMGSDAASYVSRSKYTQTCMELGYPGTQHMLADE